MRGFGAFRPGGVDDGEDEKDLGQVRFTPEETFAALSVGGYHNCALDAEGAITCWGSNEAGEVSDVPAGAFTRIFSGAFHSCALDGAGLLHCWGNNDHGQTEL